MDSSKPSIMVNNNSWYIQKSVDGNDYYIVFSKQFASSFITLQTLSLVTLIEVYTERESQGDESKTDECLKIVKDKFKDSDKGKSGNDFLNAIKELVKFLEDNNLVEAIDTKLDLRDDV